MEPFTIQCTTCKARLIVKDESVIGDILGCPKCHSMVQVVPPLGWKRPPSDVSSSGAFADVEAAGTNASNSATQKTVSQHAAPQKVAPQNAAPVAKKPSTQKVVDKQAAAVIPPALPPRQTPPQSAPSQPLPSPLAQVASRRTPPESPSVAPPSVAAAPSRMANLAARARQDWMVLAGGLCGGVMLGVTVWLVLAMQASEPEIVASATHPAESPAENAPPRPAAAAVEVPAPSAASPTVEPTPPAEPASEASAAAVAQQDQNSSELPQDTTRPPREATKAAAPQAAAKDSGPALKLDPVPAPTSLAPLPLAAPSAADTPAPDEPPPIAEPPNAPPSPAAPTPLSAEEIDRRLAVSLGAVEFADVTLAQFASFIADVSGVPVTFDEKALATRGSGRRTKVTLKLQRTTAGDALRAAIKSVGLTFTVSDDGQIVVTAGKD